MRDGRERESESQGVRGMMQVEVEKIELKKGGWR